MFSCHLPHERNPSISNKVSDFLYSSTIQYRLLHHLAASTFLYRSQSSIVNVFFEMLHDCNLLFSCPQYFFHEYIELLLSLLLSRFSCLKEVKTKALYVTFNVTQRLIKICINSQNIYKITR